MNMAKNGDSAGKIYSYLQMSLEWDFRLWKKESIPEGQKAVGRFLLGKSMAVPFGLDCMRRA